MAIAAPPIVHDPIPFGSRRIAETRAYAVRHYGLHRARLIAPKVIVERMTENAPFSETFNTFAPDVPDSELHELPGTRWLQAKYGITDNNVIGHAESLTSRYHHENVVRLKTQTHGDWPHRFMVTYRRDLAAE